MQVNGDGGPSLSRRWGAQRVHISGSSFQLLVGSAYTGRLAAWAVAASLGPRVIVREETVGIWVGVGLPWPWCPVRP